MGVPTHSNALGSTETLPQILSARKGFLKGHIYAKLEDKL